jgi:hypothetical protein
MWHVMWMPCTYEIDIRELAWIVKVVQKCQKNWYICFELSNYIFALCIIFQHSCAELAINLQYPIVKSIEENKGGSTLGSKSKKFGVKALLNGPYLKTRDHTQAQRSISSTWRTTGILLGATTKLWKESEVQLKPFHFFTPWTLDPSVNTLGPKSCIDQLDRSILEFL